LLRILAPQLLFFLNEVVNSNVINSL
jgi:hypothetical protein